MSRFRTNNPLGGFGVNQRYNAPGVTPTFTQPDQTAGQLGGLIDASLATAGRVVDFQLAAEQMRLNKERQNLAAERVRQEAEAFEAEKTRKFREGLGNEAFQNFIVPIESDIENATIQPPASFDPQSLAQWSRTEALLYAKRAGVDSDPITLDAFVERVSPRMIAKVVNKLDQTGEESKDFYAAKSVSLALAGDASILDETQRNQNLTQDQATVKMWLPYAQALADAGEPERLAETKDRLSVAFKGKYDQLFRIAQNNKQTNELNVERASFDGLYQELARLNPAPNQPANLGELSALRAKTVSLAQQSPKFADTGNALVNSIDSIVQSALDNQEKASKDAIVSGTQDKIVRGFLQVSETGGLSSSLGDRNFEVNVEGVNVSMTPSDIKNRVRDIKFSQIQERIATDPSIPDADKPRAYGLEIARWAGKNGMTLDNVKTQMGESFSLLQEAMADGSQDRDQKIARAAQSFETYKGVIAAKNNALGNPDSNVMFFDTALLIQENAQHIFGKPLTNADVMQLVYRNVENPKASKEKIAETAKDAASRWFSADAKNVGEVEGQIRSTLTALTVMGSGLPEDKILERAKELTEKQGQILNGYWTKLRQPIKTEYEGKFNANDGIKTMAARIATSLKGNADYVVNGEDIGVSDIALHQDQQTGLMFFVDKRVGNGKRVFSNALGLPSSFSQDSLVQQLNSLATERATASYVPYLPPAGLQ